MEQILRCRSVVLRDRRESDIDDYIRWNTEKTWWRDWDAPWENAPPRPGEEPEQRIARIRGLLMAALSRPLPPVRRSFEVIGLEDVHLGWVNSYHTGNEGKLIAIGIDLPDLEQGGPGIGTIAFSLKAAYRMRMDGIAELYTETWSGNLPMIGLAKRVGFVECRRSIRSREVRGRVYDGLRFVVDHERLYRHCPWLKEAELPTVDQSPAN
jgi:RimJ/RimL family protein N-acetyltransferase